MRLRFILLSLCFAAGPAFAACSRPIVVPASPLGKNIVIEANGIDVSGVYVETLRDYGKRFGCEFQFPVMPRLRAELTVQAGQADLFIGTIKVPERDAWGDFVPMLGTEWMLITEQADAPRSLQELLERPALRFNAVRGFNYGPAYLEMMAALEKRGWLEYVNDPQTIVRKMQAGRVDYTYMPSQTFAGALDEVGVRDTLGKRIRYLRLAGIPPQINGIYMSRKLAPADAQQLEALLVQIRRDGEFLRRMRLIFTPEELSSMYALPASALRKP